MPKIEGSAASLFGDTANEKKKKKSTYRHPELMPLLCRCSDLYFSPRSRHDDTLGEQTRRLDVGVLDNIDVRDEHCIMLC